MKIKDAQFIKSSYSLADLPAEVYPEYAFIGRSNVGKSSLINMLVEKKNLAKTSSTPGKTRSINHFLINENWYLVDLPGYGYAKVSKKERNQWRKLIFDYLQKRRNLMLLFVLIDSRIEPQKNDLEFINSLGHKALPFMIIFTKSDKINKNKLIHNISLFKKEMLKTWEELPQIIISSAITGQGREEILSIIYNLNQDFDAFGRKQIKYK